jgi:hypothetical protein
MADAQALAAAAAAAALAGVVPPAPAFRLAPGTGNAILDLNPGGTGIKIYNKATAPLDPKFDGKQENLGVFLSNIADRTNQFGMRQVLIIPDGVNHYDLITQYGLRSLEEVIAAAEGYVGDTTRQVQNSYMVYHMLTNSLTAEFKAKVLLHASKYVVTRGNNSMSDGPCLLKVIINLTYLDTRATTSHIRDTLVSASEKLALLNGNIETFNNWVREQTGKLTARGETCQDLLIYLFHAYSSAPDQVFKDYIKDRRNEYKDGTRNMTSEGLMLLADNKYHARVQSSEWAKPSGEQEEIVALQAKIAGISKMMQQKKKPKATTPKPKGPGKGKQEQKKKNDQKYAWKTVPPKTGEAQNKVFQTKTYYWCTNHGTGMWTLHKPEECNMGKNSEDALRRTPAPNSGTDAHAAVIPGFADEELEGEEEESDRE